ncbi:glycosyltransferase [Magnetospirillum molischianum]|uniref:Glycosyltransferase n=1 Tax=Magnetospirillum molischianum DSM 120 TaxID=1150626 RepID=H8FQ65_MAGML|nr:glycosyltransferase [Magnetospirillum molischianum]CCG40503.1 Glycosyltransferase [Magnetospirillum molischianum DSM 120]
MTRLLQMMAGARHGGAEAFFERLAPALARAGLAQHLLIRADAERAARLRAAGLEVTELGFGGALDLFTRRRAATIAKTFRPDIALAWMNRAARFLPKGDIVRVGRLGGYYDLKYYRACDHLAGNTPDLCAWIAKQGWPADRVHYLPNFAADPGPSPEPLPRQSFDTPPEAKLIVALGRLHPNKGFDVLLRAVARVEGAVLWLAGEGPLRAELTAQAETLGIASRVRFLGWRDDGPRLLASADLFVCPSRHEPLGNVVIEAWAAARPVIAAASQGPSQLIRDGIDGLLVPVDDDDAMAAGLARLLADPALAATLASAGRAAYDAHFTEAAVVARYIEFFERVKR